MSAGAEAGEENKACCASCGIIGGDKLKDCSACKLVKYCGIECQKKHRKEHKKECKRRMAEQRDELLFKQPESSCLGDCPICYFPLSLDLEESTLWECCYKRICVGCAYATMKREKERRLEYKCPFCRYVMERSESEEDKINLTKRRAEANDPAALYDIGDMYHSEGDYISAFECFSKAVAFGNYAPAHRELSLMYHDGEGVEKDTKKRVYHFEEAAIGGDLIARHNLGYLEELLGNMDRAVKHWIIAANLGYDDSLESLKKYYRKGLVSKDDLASALRAHQAAVDATKSPTREEAEAAALRWRNRKKK